MHRIAKPHGLLALGTLVLLLGGCAGPGGGTREGPSATPGAVAPVPPPRAASRVAKPRTKHEQVLVLAQQLLPPQVPDRARWAEDLATSFVALAIPPEPRKVCAVAAVIEQESGWQVDPVVPDLPAISRREIEKKLERYKIPTALLDVALRKESPNGKTYAERLGQVRTERHLSRLYDDMIGELPLGQQLFGGMNPVRTGGPMQVDIDFAAALMRERPYPWRNAGSAREEVFTRRGGVYFGSAMLLDYPVSYDRMLYRFADYNAGRYASRNAAFQRLIAALSGQALAPDGDLLSYRGGTPVGTSQTEAAIAAIPGLDLDRAAIRHDLRLEKSFDFERTALYARIRELAARRGLPTPAASVPDILLESPKITRKLTTRWFAERVETRYRRCLARHQPAGA
jgi:hypothetical protein